mgnify:CR=1 FL=1
MANILAVDDDEDLCSLLKRALEKDGHQVVALQSGKELDEKKCRWADCILLDVMMPGEDGFSLCSRIRGLADCPILFLTAKTEEEAVVYGLGLGADDYLLKPFRIGELRARVNAHLRRQQRTPQNRVRRGGLDFDLPGKTITCREQPVKLTRGEYEICEYLALHAGQVFSREQIYEAVFGYDGEADASAVTEHIKNIRARFKEVGVQPIQTVWGIGYKWEKE